MTTIGRWLSSKWAELGPGWAELAGLNDKLSLILSTFTEDDDDDDDDESGTVCSRNWLDDDINSFYSNNSSNSNFTARSKTQHSLTLCANSTVMERDFITRLLFTDVYSQWNSCPRWLLVGCVVVDLEQAETDNQMSSSPVRGSDGLLIEELYHLKYGRSFVIFGTGCYSHRGA